MRPRDEGAWRSGAASLTWEPIVFGVIVFVLTAFGLLMIYSASSITALTSEATGHNPTYYLTHQLGFVVAGTMVAIVIALNDYHVWSETLCLLILIATVGLLFAVIFTSAGQDAYGATRWISVGPLHLQPSEFAKASVILAAASALQRYYEYDGDLTGLGIRLAVMVGLPLLLILLQPDKGTVCIVGATVAVMLFLAGMPLKYVLAVGGAAIAIVLALAFKDDYSRARIATMWDPWKDPDKSGYQVIQGLYAFGSGGLFGTGLGNSRQKYSYLPMAHNDFIYAVIGEELGLVGTLAVLALFALLIWIGFRIARSAPDLSGRLIASGCMTLLAIQLCINAGGVLCMIPLSGKPIPFISYGGSSIISTLILMGLVLSVARTSQASSSRGFTVHEGTAQSLRVIEGGLGSPADGYGSRDAQGLMGRISRNANGTRRIDLGPSASDRLRGRDTGRGGRG